MSVGKGGEPTRSFRRVLGVRMTAAMTVAVGAVSALSYLGLRLALDMELNASLMNVASVQAASVTDDPTGEMRFHEWNLTPEEAVSLRDLNRYAQIWSAEGESLVRSQFLVQDLPMDREALELSAAGELVWRESVFQGVSVRALYYPLERLGELHTRHVLQVAAPLEARNRMLGTVRLLLLAIVATSAVSTYFGARWLAERTVRPVDAVIDQAEAIARGSPRRRIEAYADTEEYQRLVQVLNQMLGRLDDALEAQKRFTADASHELRTPLTVLRGEIEVALRRSRTEEEYVKVLSSALEETERLSRLAEDLLTLTRSEAGVLQPQLEDVDISERVRRIVTRLAQQAESKRVRIIGPGRACVPARVDPDLLDQAVWNLVGNAVDFSPPDGTVEIRIRAENGGLTMEVEDSGPGVPADQRDRIFERFFRGDESRTQSEGLSGTGLGLAITKAVVDLHEGEINVEDRPGGGAMFRVFLPQALFSLPQD